MENSYTINQTKENLLKAFKQFQNSDIQLMPIEDEYIRCPFRLTKDGQFEACYLYQCMAFRRDDKVFWCARLESRNKNKTAKYPSLKELGSDIE